ncbi:hypothetical protein AXX17_ATUG01480 [Arabidopsis thaliana]|uniref:Uncharacterized protein n=1 Tax=Arabidopsis thaliana TaxID=3702 RepID=A0A178U6T8_ARATH|nr:hypothetical protein AXX17_ATUG01480 [Arabidopsis thaliana]
MQQFQGSYQQQQYAPLCFAQQQPTHNAHDADMKSILHQILQGQSFGSMVLETKLAEINTMVDSSYNALNIEFEALNSRLKYMEGQIASPLAPTPPGQFPGKAIQNSKAYAHAVTLRSGRKLLHHQHTEKIIEDSEPTILDQHHNTRRTVNQHTKGRIRIKTKSKPMNQLYLISLQLHSTLYSIEQNQLLKKEKLLLQQRIKNLLLRLKEIELRMPLMDAFKLIPHSHKYLKDLIMERIKEVQGMEVQSQECNHIIHKERVPEKLEELAVEDQLQTSLTKK